MFKKTIINFEKKISQGLMNDIISGKKINFNKYKLATFKDKIYQIEKEYHNFSRERKSGEPRYWSFWKIISLKYSNFKKNLEIKNESNISPLSKCKNNINRTMYTKYLGFNPSILTLLLFDTEITDLISQTNYSFYKSFKSTANFWPSTEKEKKLINSCLIKNNINIISNLCPDYDNKKLGEDLYSYTFNQLNEGEGLGGIRILNNLKKIKDFFSYNNKNIKYNIFYGDFESFSKENCDRLKIDKKTFLQKLKKSMIAMQKHDQFNKVNFFVEEFLNEQEWIKRKDINKQKIINHFTSNDIFKKEVFEIARSRKMLYKSWFPKLNSNNYFELVIDQGAEYATMGDIISDKYENPIIIGADHPRMKIFYYFNCDIPVIYLNKGY